MSRNRLLLRGMVCLLAAGASSQHLIGAPATMPAASATTAPARTMQAIMTDVQTTSQELGSVLSPTALTDPAARAAAAPKATPILKKLQSLGMELQNSNAMGQQVGRQIVSQIRPLLLAFDDADSLAAAKVEAAGADAQAALSAKADLMFADWIKASGDAAAQGKLLDTGEAMAKEHATDQQITQTLAMMGQVGPANAELRKRAMTAAGSMQNAMASSIKQQAEGEAKIRSFENKPLAITGPMVDGKSFTTADWKGKVILVDFWATWCGPCREELPRVKKAYADYHAKGLEVLGVSNDHDAKSLTDFTAADPGMPWPQLFDAKAAADQQWNPITTGFGINGIPTMFLIDKKGVLRTTDARADFETQIPKMLAE